ncbi:MAG: delta-60 repeat domain-containing protein [Planctomycetota bacterium]
MPATLRPTSVRRSRSRTSPSAVGVVAAFVLASCGGGGGGGGHDLGSTFNHADGFSGRVDALATDPSGRLWIGGSFSSVGAVAAPNITRFLANGGIDPSFDPGLGANQAVWAIAPFADATGRAFVGGNFTTFGGANDRYLTLVDEDGALDPSFDPGAGPDGPVLAIELADDGSGDAWICGSFSHYDGANSVGLARIAQDGALVLAVPGSGIDGVPLVLSSTGDGSGDVYVGGIFEDFSGTSIGCLARVSGTTGALAPAFAIGSGFTWSSFGGARVDDIALAEDSSGDLFVGGRFDACNGSPITHLARIRSNGTLVAGFPAAGAPSAPVEALVAARDGSGDVWIAGGFGAIGATGVTRIARLAPDGTPDLSYAPPSGGIAYQPEVMAIAGDGSNDLCLGGGFTAYGGEPYQGFVRVDASGAVDASSPRGGGIGGNTYAVLPLEDGDVLVGGVLETYDGTAVQQLIRLGPDGSFVENVSTVIGIPYDLCRDAIDPDAIYMVGTFTHVDGLAAKNITRFLLSTGDADPNFIAGIFPGTGPNVQVVAAQPFPTGGVLVNGPYSTWDGNFCRNLVVVDALGIDYLNNGFFDGGVSGYAYADDGSDRLWVCGNFSAWNSGIAVHAGIGLLEPAGNFFSPDAGFDGGTGFSGIARAVAVRPGTGAAWFGGAFSSYDGTSAGNIVCVLPDGSVDPTFHSGTGFDGEVKFVVAAADGTGDVYVAGDFTHYDGAAVSKFVRLDPDGSLDAAFDTGSGFDGAIQHIVPVGGGSRELYVCGQFRSYDGVTTGSLVRLNADGSLD